MDAAGEKSPRQSYVSVSPVNYNNAKRWPLVKSRTGDYMPIHLLIVFNGHSTRPLHSTEFIHGTDPGDKTHGWLGHKPSERT